MSQLLADKLKNKASLIRIDFKSSSVLKRTSAIASGPEAVQTNPNH